MTQLATSRLTLRDFTADDLPEFAALHAEPSTMADLGGPISQTESRAKLQRYLDGLKQFGTSRMYVSDAQGFVGYVGVVIRGDNHPLGSHGEIGWRLLPRAWGEGYAPEAARAVLTHAFAITGLPCIYAHTAPDNQKSQAVMRKLNLTRCPELDFVEDYPPIGQWHGRVWVAARADYAGFTGGIE
ncbi:MAG: GNAT family N-acetyltransferase [Pseudomonadota bacterium]